MLLDGCPYLYFLSLLSLRQLADDMLHDHNARELDREQFVASAFAGEVGDLVRESLKTKTFSGARLGGTAIGLKMTERGCGYFGTDREV